MQRNSTPPAWFPESCRFPLVDTTVVERSGRLKFDNRETPAAQGGYGEVFRGAYVDDTGTEYRMCAKRDWFLTFLETVDSTDQPPITDEELRVFYTRVRNDLTAAWRLIDEPRVVRYLTVSTTTRKVGDRDVMLPEYFIMEEEGDSLATWIAAHPACAENRAAFEGYVECILEGLAALHAAGITHRDVNPHNVVICRHDPAIAKIIDLGLAKCDVTLCVKAVDSMTAGTPWYMAPEYMDPQRASQAVDVWAVGVMCAERLLEEQVGRREAKQRLQDSQNGANGLSAVHRCLQLSHTASASPSSLLEVVVANTLHLHAPARFSAAELVGTVATAPDSFRRKHAALTTWLRQTCHALQDCCRMLPDHQLVQFYTQQFVSLEFESAPAAALQLLFLISKALVLNRQRAPLILRVARNVLQSLVDYSVVDGETNAAKHELLQFLGFVYVQMGGSANLQRALQTFNRLEDAMPGNADVLHYTGIVLFTLGTAAQLHRAIEYFDRAIELKTTLLGADDPSTASTLHQKARVLFTLGGTENVLAAVALYDRAIETNTAKLGADHLETAANLHEKANALVRLDGVTHLHEALALFDRVIEIKTEKLGPNHPDTAITMHQKADALIETGDSTDLQTAITLFDRVIEISSAALGFDHSDTASTMDAKANALVRMGGPHNLHTAIALFDHVIRIKSVSLGSDHIKTAVSMHNKARALVKIGGAENLHAAITLFDRVMEINTAAFGGDDLDTATAVQEKASALLVADFAGNVNEALRLYDWAIEIETAALGPTHPKLAPCLLAKANAYVQMDGEEMKRTAMALYDHVISILTAAFGDGHLHTAAALQTKARAMVKYMGTAESLTTAIELYGRVIEIATAAYGVDHAITAIVVEDRERAESYLSEPSEGFWV
jgi:serine/threonine protein kinase